MLPVQHPHWLSVYLSQRPDYLSMHPAQLATDIVYEPTNLWETPGLLRCASALTYWAKEAQMAPCSPSVFICYVCTMRQSTMFQTQMPRTCASRSQKLRLLYTIWSQVNFRTYFDDKIYILVPLSENFGNRCFATFLVNVAPLWRYNLDNNLWKPFFISEIRFENSLNVRSRKCVK